MSFIETFFIADSTLIKYPQITALKNLYSPKLMSIENANAMAFEETIKESPIISEGASLAHG